ncbi:chalcone isomerase family protein [Seminibacterium arietis]|uniref:Chalcone isomerase family protein n=1 Tax=Seminibacterium arietis TaxID=1173502 RepID=A0ABW3I630_9PAST
MKFKGCLFFIFYLFSTALLAKWQQVGNADYNWGPFQVYTVSLYTENGEYEDNQTPLMISFKYDKPIEGKNFAISLIKEIDALQLSENKEQWLTELQAILPDFSPNDVLTYIALDSKGYFILNDAVLEHEFDAEFNQAFISIWLSDKSVFSQLQKPLLGKDKMPHNLEERLLPLPKVKILDEEDADPQLPPLFKITEDQAKLMC